jgi:hypothetical protein
VRSRTFRLAKPGAIERYRYSLTANGDPDWEREPWKTALALRRAAEGRISTKGTPRQVKKEGTAMSQER